MRMIGLALLAMMAVASAASAADDTAALAATLERGLGYWRAGDDASARAVLATVLRLDGLPPDVHGQAEAYAAAAQNALAGRPTAVGYAVASAGHYGEKDTAAGPGLADDFYVGLRIGGRLNLPASPTLAINASFDYRFRPYDDPERRDESDLRWGLGGSRALGAASLGFGTRGWISHRGGGITRNDAGIYADLRWAAGDDDQFNAGIELRRRSYPEGRLRYRSRDIIEATGGWTHTLAGGRASLTLTGHGGREFALAGNPYGDSNFIGLSPSLDVGLTESIAANAYAWWQRGRYNRELLPEAADNGTVGSRADTLLEFGAGVQWSFAPGWEVGPSLLHLHDRSNVVGNNYRSTEVLMTLRRDF